jgi:molecular chaperone GrpE
MSEPAMSGQAANGAAPGAGDPTTGDPTTGDPTTGDPTTGDPTTGDPTTGDPTTGGAGTAGVPATGDLAARVAELEDQRLRALADLDNLRKRCAAQLRTAEADTVARVAAQWLPVVDNLERALAHARADPGSIIAGVRAVRDQATAVLAQLGFSRRDDLGATFDPARHEAIAARPDPAAPDGSVIEVVQPAYGDDERQLRPAQVVVAKAD